MPCTDKEKKEMDKLQLECRGIAQDMGFFRGKDVKKLNKLRALQKKCSK